MRSFSDDGLCGGGGGGDRPRPPSIETARSQPAGNRECRLRLIPAFTETHIYLCLAVTGTVVNGAVTCIAVTRIADTERERLAQAHFSSAQERRFAETTLRNLENRRP